MISQDEVAELGKALADINRRYTADDMRKILEYALEHPQLLGHPHDVAEMVEDFAKRLREFDWEPDPLGHWRTAKKDRLRT
jgi:hypothetical protein